MSNSFALHYVAHMPSVKRKSNFSEPDSKEKKIDEYLPFTIPFCIGSATGKAYSYLMDTLAQEQKRICSLMNVNLDDIGHNLMGSERVGTNQATATVTKNDYDYRSIVDLAQTVCAHMGLSKFPRFAKLHSSDVGWARADDTTLFFNTARIRNRTENARKFIIAHELSHFIHRDVGLRTHMKLYLGAQEDAHKLLVNKWYQLQELRADIQAAMQGISFAQGYLDFAHTLDCTSSDDAQDVHPADAKRLALARALLPFVYAQVPQEQLETTMQKNLQECIISILPDSIKKPQESHRIFC